MERVQHKPAACLRLQSWKNLQLQPESLHPYVGQYRGCLLYTSRTDLIAASRLNSASDLYLKTENLQGTGSFKVRGAYYKISQLTAEERAKGAVSYTHLDVYKRQVRYCLRAFCR